MWDNRRIVSTWGEANVPQIAVALSEKNNSIRRATWRTPGSRVLNIRVIIAALFTLIPIQNMAYAQPDPANLADLTLEQLTDIVVTTVSKREERLSAANAAIFVITAEDIRRSGVTTLPEALRMAPTLDVARSDTNSYAISARGFNTVAANNLLVLIDGRTVYSPLFSGVFWEAQQVVLADIDRIEVISGPNSTLWGSNAVNGVINIITRNAQTTQGMLVTAGGSEVESRSTLRYGGKVGSGHYRIYGRYADFKNAIREDGLPVRDSSTMMQTGFRSDWGDTLNNVTLQSDFYESHIDQLSAADRKSSVGRIVSGFNLLGRWQHELQDGSRLRLQSYVDRAERNSSSQYVDRIDTWDVEFQHALVPGATHTFIWGGGARFSKDRFTNGPTIMFTPADRDLRLFNIFAQDSVMLKPNVELTLGAKMERNSYTGNEFLPTVRLTARPMQDVTVWAAASRALRTPTRLDTDLNIPLANGGKLIGNPNFQSEITDVLEGGLRSQLTPAFSYTVTVYHNVHDRLRSFEAIPGQSTWFDNKIEGTSKGASMWGTYQAAPHWRLIMGGSWQHLDLKRKPGGNDDGQGIRGAGNDPKYWGSLRSLWDITPQHELDVNVRRVGARPDPVVSAYTAVDIRLGWRPAKTWDVSLTLRNINDKFHNEWISSNTSTSFERSAYLKLTWRP